MAASRVALAVVALLAAAALVALLAPRGLAVVGVAVLGGLAGRLAWLRPRPGVTAPVVDDVPRAVRPLLLEPIVEPMATAVLLLDDRHMVVAASNAAARLFETTPSAMKGRSLIRATSDYSLLQVARDAPEEATDVTLASGRILRVAARRIDAAPVRTLLTLDDRTELQAAQRARVDLVANVSHELRTPITAALALAETLEAGVPDADDRARFHHQLTTEIQRLGRMVDRLLRLSRIESADEQFHLEAVEPAELLATAADRIEPLAAEGRRIVVDASDAPAVLADRERVLEVLTNLLDNALRFSPPDGAVTLSAVREGREARFEVRDEGPGILPSERTRIFERFYTGDRARSPGSGGSGLGLAIAREIVSRHHGRIWIAPSPRGAAVRFTLPLARDGEPLVPGNDA